MQYAALEPSIPLTIAEPDLPGRGFLWQQYLQLLVRRKVPVKARRYFVLHVEDLIRETHQTPLRSLRRDVLEAFIRRRVG